MPAQESRQGLYNDLPGFEHATDKTQRWKSHPVRHNTASQEGRQRMTPAHKFLLICFVLTNLFRPVRAQNTITMTNTEPGNIKLESLFQMADTVALVKVVSGDTENYPKTVYKGQVVTSFKGAVDGATIYFGPYVGIKLGWEYVLFLRNAAKPLTPNSTSSANYGAVQYSEIFNEGYSSMESSYQCVFDGKEIHQQCDDGVRVCTDYITLPKSLPVFPPMTEDMPFGCRWVRRNAFLSELDSLRAFSQNPETAKPQAGIDFSQDPCGNPLMESMIWMPVKGNVSQVVDGRTILLTLADGHHLYVRLAGVKLSSVTNINRSAEQFLAERLLNKQVEVLVNPSDWPDSSKKPDEITGVVHSRGNNKGTLSAEHHGKPDTETREQARRINHLAFGVMTAGCRFEPCPDHHFNQTLTIECV
jgi:hypothetical protein